MVPLVRCLGAGSCPAVSLAPEDHLTRLCDSVRPVSSQVQGHPPHSSEGSRCPWLVRGISVLLAKDVMVPVPPADMKAGFFSPYFIVPKKSGGLRPILGLRILMLKMLMQNRVFGCIRPQVRSAALTWRPVLPCVDPSVPQAIPAVCVRRTSISVQVLPFGLSLSPRVFTKVAEAALVPLRDQGVRILNYLDDWLILAQSQDQLCEHRDWCSRTSASWAFGSTGKRANSCRCRGSLFSVWSLDSVNQTARLTQERAQSVLNCLNTFKNRTRHHWNSFRGSWGIWRLRRRSRRWGCSIWDRFNTGSMAESRGGRGRAARWGSKSLQPAAKPSLRGQTFHSFGQECPWNRSPGTLWFTQTPPPRAGGPRSTGMQCQGLDGSPTALAHQLPRVAGSTPGLEPSQETLTRRACTSPYGQHSDRCVHQPTRWSTLPSHVTTRPPPPPLESEASEVASRHSYPGLAQPDSRRAVTSCAPRRMETPSPDGPADLATFWTRTDRPVRVPRDVALPVVLLPDRWNTRHGRTGTQLAAGPSQICISPSEPSRTDSVQGQRGRGADPARGTILAYQDLVPRADAPRDSPSLADSSEEGSTDSETGHLMAPASRPLETSCLVPRRDAEVLGDLPQGVVDTITSARAPSTRHAYALKWNLFVEWCSSHREDPRRCPIRVVLSFLQQGLERRLSPSTLKVYVAAIAANHDPVEGKSVGKHDWVVRFLRGARRLNPPRPPSIPSWDLSLVLRALQQGPFEPLQTVEPKFLSMKTLLLLALASIKRVGDLHAFSVDDSCLQFGPADSQIILRPRPGYVPKVPTTPFRDQVVSLQALPPEEADPALALLVPSEH